MIRKIIFAPDSFKGTLTAQEVCSVLYHSALRHLPGAELISLPISDGGDGLIAALHSVLGGHLMTLSVSGPLGHSVDAEYLLLPNGTAVVEMAAASGISLLSPEQCSAMTTTTYGTGQLIAHALDSGATSLVIGLGGSATNDGGAGAACALGALLQDVNGDAIYPSGAGLGALEKINTASLHPKLRDFPVTIACDVDNILCGPYGASAIYGPQKGATPDQIALLDKNLHHWCTLLEANCEKPLKTLPGTGAAGGSALPFLAWTDAKLRRGIEIVLDLLEFDRHLDGCSLVVTGEGSTDAQSAMGKALFGVCNRAKANGVPVVVLSGGLGFGAESLFEYGASAMFSCCPKPMPLEKALALARENLTTSADNLFRLLAVMVSI